MRLFTHNFLQCHVKGCTQNNFPLRITDAEVQRKEADFNPAFLIGFLDKLEWGALRTAVQDLGLPESLPEAKPEGLEEDDELLKTLHGLLLESFVDSGKMTCPGCGHVYVIRDGIPNMLLAEDEV